MPSSPTHPFGKMQINSIDTLVTCTHRADTAFDLSASIPAQNTVRVRSLLQTAAVMSTELDLQAWSAP